MLSHHLMVAYNFDSIFGRYFLEFVRLLRIKTNHLFQVCLLSRDQIENIRQTHIRAEESSDLSLVENHLQHVVSKSFVEWHRSNINEVACQICGDPLLTIYGANTNNIKGHEEVFVVHLVSQLFLLDRVC